MTPGSVVPTLQFQQNSNRSTEEDGYELSEKQNDEEEKEEILIHWQEKLYSRKEFEYFSDPLNCTTSLEKKYCEDIQYLKRQVFLTVISNDTLTEYSYFGV